MASETSQFESSEMLATFLASTPLLEESWRLCSRANAAHQRSFAVNVVGEVAYVAFSGVQVVEEKFWNLVEVETRAKGVFGSFPWHVGREDAVMVHAGLLQLFLSFYQNHNFQQKIFEILKQSKSVVFTGHSLGGAVASLSSLWLLSHNIHHQTIFCITYGSPLLANQPFSQAILQERWTGNFCHVIARHDMLPRLLFTPPSPSLAPHLRALFQFWHMAMSSSNREPVALALSDKEKGQLFDKVLACVQRRLRKWGEEDDHDDKETMLGLYWPFGSYVFCTEKGAICMDNATAIVELLHLTMREGCAEASVGDHLKYEDYVGRVCVQYLRKGNLEVEFSESSNEAGIAMALSSSGVSSQESVNYERAANCLAKARQSGWRRNLNNAKMAVALAKITPCRAELEWYKAFCDASHDQLGYYDSFKQRRGASKRDFKVNMNRIKLGTFWNNLIEKLETNHLTNDFHKLLKYVNASHFYKLLVEPLEIAEYYRTGQHREKGDYMNHGREKRFKVFDKWWGDRIVGDEESKPRSEYASLTQDSCFWARVEEARDCIDCFSREMDSGRRMVLVGNVEEFDKYARGMIERKEVSVDVLARNSSYSVFVEEWRGIKVQLEMVAPCIPGFQDGMVQ